MNGSPVAALIRGWVDLYTRGMPAEPRAARRAEIDDDVWCEHQEAVATGRSSRSLGADMLLRFLFGMPADISWRLTYRAPAPGPSPDPSLSGGTRTPGAFAIVAALTYGFLIVLFVPFGEALWYGDSGVFAVLGSIVGAFAFSAAALGLSWRFQDRVGLIGGFGAMVVTLGAAASLVGLIVPLLVGSAMLMWDLGRIGVVSRLIPVVHLATAILVTWLAIGQPDLDDAATRALFVALLAPFLVSWFVVGVSMYRGEPKARAISA